METMIEELISRVFNARNAAHLAHWAETNAARHETFGDFYISLIYSVDEVVEAYVGMFGEKPGKVDLVDTPIDDWVEYLRGEVDWLESSRDELSGGSDSVAALIDALAGIYLKCCYKLDNLK
jgi:hypothetical protein